MPKKKNKRRNQLGKSLVNQKGKKKRLQQQQNASGRPKRKTGPDDKLNIQTTERVFENSVLESDPLELFLAEALAEQRAYGKEESVKVIRARDEVALDMEVTKKFRSAEVFDYENLPIPRRPDWDVTTTKDELKAMEENAFLAWRRSLAKTIESRGQKNAVTPYEKNLNMWRQLWRVTERSQVIVQIIDARNPLAFLCKDLITYVAEISPTKKMMLLVNKADYLSFEQRQSWAKYFRSVGLEYIFFSALREQLNQNLLSDSNRERLTDLQLAVLTSNTSVETSNDFEASCHLVDGAGLLDKLMKRAGAGHLMVGMVGYPNVGKSSVINVLVQQKKVGVAATPGKTKHFQTIVLNDQLTLCDCPGLVFPTFMSSKSDLVLNAVVPIDNLHDFITPTRLLAARVDVALINHVFKLSLPPNSHPSFILDEFARARGLMLRTDVPNRSEGARRMLKAFVRGQLLYCHPPPKLTAEERNEFYHQNTQMKVILSSKIEESKQLAASSSADAAEEEIVAALEETIVETSLKEVMGIQQEELWDTKMGASKKKHEKKLRAERRYNDTKKRKNKRQQFFQMQPAQSTSAVPLNVNRVDRFESLGLSKVREQAI